MSELSREAIITHTKACGSYGVKTICCITRSRPLCVRVRKNVRRKLLITYLRLPRARLTFYADSEIERDREAETRTWNICIVLRKSTGGRIMPPYNAPIKLFAYGCNADHVRDHVLFALCVEPRKRVVRFSSRSFIFSLPYIATAFIYFDRNVYVSQICRVKA